MERIADLFAAEQLRTMECGPEQGLIKNWQDSLKQQQTAGMPMHEVDVSKPPQQDGMAEAMRNVFLHQAAGGPKEGFTTKNPRSHAVAQSLAKTGHLKKIGEFKHANNQQVQHWQLTEKGLAHAQTGGLGGFPVSYPKAAGGMPVTTKSPGDPSKGAAPGAGATGKNGLGQPDPKQKFKVAAGGPGSGPHASVLAKHGFATKGFNVVKTGGSKEYFHPKDFRAQGGIVNHSITVHQGGNWEHNAYLREPGAHKSEGTGSERPVKSGKDAASLGKYLDSGAWKAKA